MYLHDYIIHSVYLQQQEVPQYYQPPLLPNTIVSIINKLIRLFI